MTQLSSKLKSLEETLTDMQSVLIAYSGGTDSAFLLKVAANILGDRTIAVTASSEIHTPKELEEAGKNAEEIGAKHLVAQTNELNNPNFASNPPDKCYYCKTELFLMLFEIAKQHGLICVIDGSNCDDERDFRPGMKAAAEFRVRNPLRDAGFTKEEIRTVSKDMNLPTWDKPPLPCLSTRVPYGTPITREKVLRVASAEEYLTGFGIRQLRFSDHGDIARIEVQRADIPMFLDEEICQKTTEKFRTLGYAYVTLDIQGYRMGSMNEPLKETR